jgi:hypothetical protein
LRAAVDPRSLPGVAIRWFTDADRQDMRDAAEERRVLQELTLKYTRWIEAPDDQVDRYALKLRRIDPYRRG